LLPGEGFRLWELVSDLRARSRAASRKSAEGCCSRAPSSRTTLPGGRPGVTNTMRIVNNSSETASPRGGVGSIVMRIQSTATKVNTIRLKTWTSLRLNGEVLQRIAEETHGPRHGGSCDAFWVVGGSRLSKGSAREDGRPDRIDHRRRCLLGVRAAVGAWKPGNSGGAKGGRKANGLWT
jgi:hypothetical protein